MIKVKYWRLYELKCNNYFSVKMQAGRCANGKNMNSADSYKMLNMLMFHIQRKC